MSQPIRAYIRAIQDKFDTGWAKEHTYRAPMETLLLSLSDKIKVVNEHERIVGVGMPDLTIKSAKDTTIPIGRIEAKDLHIDLDEKKNIDQIKRYTEAFDNFIYTNNLAFVFYKNDKKVDSVILGTCDKNSIQRYEGTLFDNNIDKLHTLLTDFLSYQGQTITSPAKLARAMAQKAKLIKYAIEDILTTDPDSPLWLQYDSFRDLLIHDMDESQFADMYAQTVAYGLFAARLHDSTLPTFSREEAEKLIPKSTPFIRRLFKQMSNDDEFDERVAYIIDSLVEIFLHCDVAQILRNYGKETKMHDPIIHFYETFLGEYDAKMRKARGVYYTPEPVVQFIVRGVDHLLQKEFWLPLGLADTSKIEAEFTWQGINRRRADGRSIEKKMVHRVQVLDPATGTGTFLNEVIQYIHSTYFTSQPWARDSYVTTDLLPRIRGFEILMASYTMAHLKLGITLGELGWSGDERVNIYLTNSLEEPHDHLGTLFSQALAAESEQASKVKREQPIMVVMGNPPYSGISSNNGEWISWLIEDYKYVDGIHFGERKHWLQDDYVKFIRYAEQFIEKNNEGIIAYINNHGFLDNPTFRGMRWHLLQTFDDIYILDLHGNSKKKETTPDGSKDENVFDIQAGVSIQFFIKTGKKKKSELAQVHHADLYGRRNDKYDLLHTSNFASIKWQTITPNDPYYFLVPKDEKGRQEYEKYIKIDQLFANNKTGIVTMGDSFAIADTKEQLKNRLIDFLQTDYTEDQIKEKYWLGKNYGWWILENKKMLEIDEKKIVPISYRPFDTRRTYYDNNILRRRRNETMQHFLKWENLWLAIGRQWSVIGSPQWDIVSITKNIMDLNYYRRWGELVFPLYLYTEQIDGSVTREPNLDSDIIENICTQLHLPRNPDKNLSTSIEMTEVVGPEDILDYIYAVLHSPSYRETYAEFLKIDFPRVPFTEDPKIFWQLVDLGHQIRQLHLMEDIQMSDLQTRFLGSGDSIVSKIGKKSYHDQQVWINDSQYFDGVSETARNFYIGGYQPAQKRLKDRKDRTLSFEDVIHYQKIIYILDETDRLMGEIDEIDFM